MFDDVAQVISPVVALIVAPEGAPAPRLYVSDTGAGVLGSDA